MRVYCWSSLKIQYAHTWNYTAVISPLNLWNDLRKRFRFFVCSQTINRSVENVARFHVDAHLMPPLTKHNAVMEFILTKATEDDRIISSNFIFPEKIKNAVGVMDPHIKVSRRQINPTPNFVELFVQNGTPFKNFCDVTKNCKINRLRKTLRSTLQSNLKHLSLETFIA